jgi:hypothetical protein
MQQQPRTAPLIVKRPDGRLVAVAGASRSGKTHWTAEQVKACRRLLVWDYKGEWHLRYRCRRVRSFGELRELVKSTAPPARLAFHVEFMDADAFNLFCRYAWLWVRQAEGTLIVEETASVTSPGKAPRPWGEILRMGLGYGANVFALTQRPAESDKTALGNASIVHCHRMGTTDDRAYMAKLLDVPIAQVQALKPREWIERHDSGELVTHTERRKNGPRKSAR